MYCCEQNCTEPGRRTVHAYNPHTRDAEAGGSLPVQTGLDYQTAQFKKERERFNQGPMITWREGLAIALSFNRALAGLGLTCYTGVQEGQDKRLVHSDGGGGHRRPPSTRQMPSPHISRGS